MKPAFKSTLKAVSAGAAACFALNASAATVTIATLNNPDMIELKKLSPAFEKANPDIKLNWVILEENVLRQRATTDITTGSGQFDVMTIGAYETPQWGKRGWLTPITNLPASYDLNDVVKTARDGLSQRRPVVRAAVLRRKLDDLLPQGSVRQGRPENARPADLRPDRAIRRQAHRQSQRRRTASACAARRAGARTWRTARRW